MTVRLRSRWAVVAAVVIAVCGGVVRGDDVAVEGQPGGRPAGRVIRGMTPEYDLGQLFDAQAFGDLMEMAVAVDQVGGPLMPAGPGGGATPGADPLAHRLAPVRRRAAARIAMVDRIVGLSDKQRKKLEIAAQSDLRRLSDAVAEARAKYAGRKLKMDPRNGGLDEAGQKAMQQAQEDGQRCRQLVQGACGPDSLLAKVVVGTLDEAQANRYSTVMQGRAACRWKAVVAAGLAQLDDQVGLAQKQHDAIAALLVADVPMIDDDAAASPVPAAIQVSQRIEALGSEKIATILDPRQTRMVSQVAGQWAMQAGGNVAVDEIPGLAPVDP
jgi:hypothetical protein